MALVESFLWMKELKNAKVTNSLSVMGNHFTVVSVVIEDGLKGRGVGCIHKARATLGWPPKPYRAIEDER